MKKIAIIGGGISGLSTAYFLQDFADITIFEKDRLGGKAQSYKKDGFIFEEGVNGFLNNSPDTLELAQNIGLELIKANDNSKIRYIYDDKLYQLPSSPLQFLFSDVLSFSAKFRVFKELFIKSKDDDKDESVYDFAKRRLGKEFADKFMTSMVAGIYASTPQNTSLKAAFPKIYNLEKEYGGLFKGMMKLKKGGNPAGELMSCEYGMGDFIEKLKENTKAKFIHKEVLDIDELKDYDKVIISTPAYTASRILKKYEKLSNSLTKIEYNPVSVIGFSGEIQPISFGILTTKLRTLGILMDKYIFPNRNGFRVMMGGDRFRDVHYTSQGELEFIAKSEIFKITGVEDINIEFFKLWKNAIPNYSLGHRELVDSIRKEEKEIENIYLNSNAYDGVSFNDCISNSKKLARKIIDEDS
jgi:oxygen-dependent protoporphyrinogen oxidase